MTSRFINYANEIGQKENRLLNMFEAVGQLGFPRWVVEIRHLAAHSHVPPIETLRSATKICVEWLWNNFWARKTAREAIRASMTGDSLIENPFIAKRENKYRKVIVAYANWRYRNPTVPADYRTSSKEVLEFERLLMNETHEFSRCLIDDGMMIMTKQQYDNEYAPYVTNETSVPTRLQNFWEPIITILYERKIAAELLVLLLARLSDPSISSFTSIQIAAWTRMMIVPCAETAMEFYSELDWSRILTKIIYLPNFFGAEVIEKVMNKVPNLNPQKRKKLRKLREISKFSEPSEVVSSSLPKTVEDLQRLLAFEEMKRKSLQPTALFELCDADEWSTLPIGLPPRANVKTFTLTMDDEFLGRLRAQEREQRDFSEPPAMLIIRAKLDRDAPFDKILNLFLSNGKCRIEPCSFGEEKVSHTQIFAYTIECDDKEAEVIVQEMRSLNVDFHFMIADDKSFMEFQEPPKESLSEKLDFNNNGSKFFMENKPFHRENRSPKTPTPDFENESLNLDMIAATITEKITKNLQLSLEKNLQLSLEKSYHSPISTAVPLNPPQFLKPSPKPLTALKAIPHPDHFATVESPAARRMAVKQEALARGFSCSLCSKTSNLTFWSISMRLFPTIKRFKCTECQDVGTNFVKEMERHMRKHIKPNPNSGGRSVPLDVSRQRLVFETTDDRYLKALADLSHQAFEDVFEAAPTPLQYVQKNATPAKAFHQVFPALKGSFCREFDVRDRCHGW
ncbi:unnamed protein product [Caenorhabditis auriculariae]|uniref:Uncharacterized protein n=1 Tax=Caenorhabditis auriculariae TaxID=2777116 RepID=A0A8S1GNC2_9PELO|nr:unnamed protein product [Caenorhabditis auriculariae]